MSARITRLSTHDVRFPPSRQLDGSDAMNAAPDYSAAYVILHVDGGPDGHGMTFTIGRGNDLCCRAIEAVGAVLVGREVDGLFADMGAVFRLVTGDSQLRWTGPEKGIIHLATAAVMNALWDMFGKHAGKPVWRLIAEMSPAEMVALVDWRYLADALPPEEARARLENKADGKAARIAEMTRDGYPAYTTSAGWLGYPDDRIRALMEERRKLEQQVADLRRDLALGCGQAAGPEAEEVNGISFLAQVLPGISPKDLRGLIDEHKARLGSGAVLLIADTDGKAAVAAGVTDDLTGKVSAVDLVQAAVAELGGKGGGGRPDMAQGGGPDPGGAPKAIAAARAALAG